MSPATASPTTNKRQKTVHIKSKEPEVIHKTKVTFVVGRGETVLRLSADIDDFEFRNNWAFAYDSALSHCEPWHDPSNTSTCTDDSTRGRIIHLPDVDPKVFKVYADWICDSDIMVDDEWIDQAKRSKPKLDSTYDHAYHDIHCELYLLAQVLFDKEFQDDLINMLVRLLRFRSPVISTSLLERIWGETPKVDLLKVVIVTWMLCYGNSWHAIDLESWPVELVRDLAYEAMSVPVRHPELYSLDDIHWRRSALRNEKSKRLFTVTTVSVLYGSGYHLVSRVDYESYKITVLFHILSELVQCCLVRPTAEDFESWDGEAFVGSRAHSDLEDPCCSV